MHYIGYLRNFDTTLKEVVSDDSFRKYGDNIVKVCLLVLPLVTGNCVVHCFLFCLGCTMVVLLSKMNLLVHYGPFFLLLR